MTRWAALGIALAACGRLHFDPLADGGGADGADARGAYSGPNRTFVTSAAFTGALGGLAGADASCQQAADDAQLEGTFSALLWDLAMTPSQRLTGERGWVDLTGRPIADQPTAFDLGETLGPIDHDEHGNFIEASTWTGEIAPTSCSDWTSTTGDTTTGSSTESIYENVALNSLCSGSSHLTCVEHGRSMAVAPSPQPGRIAFVSEPVASGGGVSAFDAICNTDATTAGLPGSYLAYVATSSGGPETRFSPGAPWRRVDGTLLAPTSDPLLLADPTGVVLDSFVDQAADGSPSVTFYAWVGTPTANCSDWTDTSVTPVQAGNPANADLERLRDSLPLGCLSSRYVLCLQQ